MMLEVEENINYGIEYKINMPPKYNNRYLIVGRNLQPGFSPIPGEPTVSIRIIDRVERTSIFFTDDEMLEMFQAYLLVKESYAD